LSPEPPTKPHVVLYVDDEPANLTAFNYCFADRFAVLTAQSGAEALEVMAARPVAVLLADQRMPGMTGVELCATARERFPEVVRMIVTAYADIGAAVEAINSGQVLRYIFKPWREEQMAEVLRLGLEAYEVGVLLRQTQVRMLQHEQQATITYVLGSVLHELSNPATSLEVDLHLIDDSLRGLIESGDRVPPELREALVNLHAVAQDAVVSIKDLRERIHSFRRGERDSPVAELPADLNRAVQAAVAIVGADLRRHANLELQLGVVQPVAAEATQLSRIIVNLLSNAVEAIDPGRPEHNQVTVRTSVRADRALLEVEDTGAGIAPELLPRIFEPFVSTKSDDPARGFGLAVTRDLVQRLRGDIEVRSEPGRGTCFTVALPLAPR
jgi:two-component system, NtrC family, sensor kinase